MKLWLMILLSAVLAAPGVAQKQSAKPPFTLNLSAEPTSSLGSGVWVKVRWTNTSEQALDSSANILDATNVDPNFVFELLDKNGRPVPRKVYKFPQNSGHAEFGTLKAGASITHDVNLVRLFDLKDAGKYTLRVSRLIPEALGGGTVRSDTVPITIIE